MFYKQLKQLCEGKNISVTYFVENVMAMSRGNVTRWKNGETPTIKHLKEIAGYFNVSTDYLLGNEKTPTIDDERSEREKVFTDLILKMSDDDIDFLNQMMRKMLKDE